MKSVASFFVVMLVLLTGCTAFSTHVDKGRHFAGVRHFFVLSNLDDNHGLDASLVRALKSRGFEAEAGPLTMMPASAQALITYDDRWAWDFSTHMVHLQIAAQDPQAAFPFATAVYHKNVALSTDVDAVVDQLVGTLLQSAK